MAKKGLKNNFYGRIIKRIEKKRGKELEEYISEKDERIKVNWKQLIKDNELYQIQGNSRLPIFNDILQYLMAKDILTYMPNRGAFFIMGDNIDLSPKEDSGLSLHFKRIEDAEEFAREKYGGANYSVRVCQTLTERLNLRED